VINKLINYYAQHAYKIDTLHAIYKQVIDLAEVSLKENRSTYLMGVVESRVLDFDTVIVTSMNEGKFPAGKSQNSFIPYDVKRWRPPTFKKKDLYIHFTICLRAKNIYLL
jgi:inactivated superfamily I helicase